MKRIGFTLAFLAVLAFSVNLRLGIVSLAPVLGPVSETLGISTSAAGVFTALPGFAFALMGWTAVPVAKKLGISPALLLGGVLLLAGSVLRTVTSSYWPFLICTALVVCGIAVGNVLLPAWIQAHAKRQQTLVHMTVFTTGLGVSAMIGPLSAMWFHGAEPWRMALGVWALPAALLVVVWAVVAVRTGRDTPHTSVVDATNPAEATARATLWRAPTAIAMLLFFAMQAASFYTQVGWLPKILIDHGVTGATASLALVVIGSMGVLGGIIMPLLINRVASITPLATGISLFTLAGWVGLLWNASASPLLWALLLGIGGMSFPLALALLTARTRTALVTARLSGFVQPVGYLIAGAIPLAIGLIFSATGSWVIPLCMLATMAVIQAVVGTQAGRSVFIEDELHAATRG